MSSRPHDDFAARRHRAISHLKFKYIDRSIIAIHSRIRALAAVPRKTCKASSCCQPCPVITTAIHLLQASQDAPYPWTVAKHPLQHLANYARKTVKSIAIPPPEAPPDRPALRCAQPPSQADRRSLSTTLPRLRLSSRNGISGFTSRVAQSPPIFCHPWLRHFLPDSASSECSESDPLTKRVEMITRPRPPHQPHLEPSVFLWNPCSGDQHRDVSCQIGPAPPDPPPPHARPYNLRRDLSPSTCDLP